MIATATTTAITTHNTEDVELILAAALAAYEANGSQGSLPVPATPAGIEAITVLSEVGLQVTATGVTSTSQGMLASLAGAEFLQMDLGELSAAGVEPMEAIASLAAMLTVTDSSSAVLATGWQDAATARAAELAGAVAASAL